MPGPATSSLGTHTPRELLALTKPRVTFMVVVTAAGGLLLAPGSLDPIASLAALLAIAATVGSANALNCWLERDVDAAMERTRSRPLPAGRLSPDLALGFGLGLGAGGVLALALVTNALTSALGAAALVGYVAVYTPLKRVSASALLVGAIPGALPPLMGWTAVTGSLEPGGLALFALLFAWQIPHFLAIAIVRKDEYARAGLRPASVVYRARVVRWQALASAVVLWAASLALVPLELAGRAYLLVAAIGGGVFVGLAAKGLARHVERAWARGLFAGSIVHLVVLIVALVADAR